MAHLRITGIDCHIGSQLTEVAPFGEALDRVLELVTSLHQEETFIPLTKVQISPPLPTGESQFEFVAVNKDQVVYVGEDVE
jgi:hypothetical protein